MTGYPLVLRHEDIKRVLNRNASRLILTGTVRPGAHHLQDAQIVRKNERHRKNGRHDLQQDPTVRHITITHVDTIPLIVVDLTIVLAAGFKTQRDFYDDWLARRHTIDPDLPVHVVHFSPAEPVRLLHRRLHRGYTTDPRQAAPGEPEALSAIDLKKYADTAAWRYEQQHRDEMARRQAESLKLRRRQAEARGDYEEAVLLTQELADLARHASAA